MTKMLSRGDCIDLDFDHQFIPAEKKEKRSSTGSSKNSLLEGKHIEKV